MATPFTFGNLLKYGPDSCLNAKGRPTFLHRVRKYSKLYVKHTHTHPTMEWDLSPRQVVERRNSGGGFICSRSRLGVDSSKYDLFMTHRDVLKPPKKQRFTHDRRRKMHRILSPMSKHFDSNCVTKKNANITINFITYTLQIDSDECN